MKTILYTLIVGLAIALGAPAHAAFPGNQLSPILPWTGSYYDRAQGGSGLIVDIGPSGGMFVTFATYDTEGRQVNWIAEVPYEPTSNSERAETGVIGVAHANFYIATNGQCPGCPYQAPTRTFVNETATFVWENPRHVVMTLDNSGYVYNFLAVNMEGLDDDEFIDGMWVVATEEDLTPVYTDRPVSLALVSITPAPFTTDDIFVLPNAAPSVTMPPAGAKLHVVTCARNIKYSNGESYTVPDPAACNTVMQRLYEGANIIGSGVLTQEMAVIWFDPVTHRAGIETVHPEADGYAIGPTNFHWDLYIGPNRMQSRVLVQGDANTVVRDGDTLDSLTWTRVRAASVRFASDYEGDNE